MQLDRVLNYLIQVPFLLKFGSDYPDFQPGLFHDFSFTETGLSHFRKLNQAKGCDQAYQSCRM